MYKKIVLLFILFAFQQNGNCQILSEIAPPFNLKTISFSQDQKNQIPVFRLGEPFILSFDDLYEHYNYNWTKTDLSKSEYYDGIDNQRILEYENSFNTLQTYSHYTIHFQSNANRILRSGNYLLTVFNNAKEIVFTKKIIIYEDLSQVPMQVRRARNVADLSSKQNLEFSVKSNIILFQNPVQNLKVVLLQNGKWDNAVYNVKPQYTIANDLVFKYDKETQFFGGNEYLYFDNKDIRGVNNTVGRVDSKGGLYNSYLYSDIARKNVPYTYYPDTNGSFFVRNINSKNFETEADYAWVYFTLTASETASTQNVYVTGMFNNNQLSEENKMDYNVEKGIYEKAILIKQGFNNFSYTLTDSKNKIEEKDAIDGNFYQTENQYTAVIYYRANGERYDRVIGKGETNSINIIN
jgi:Domain of unknown function (DUF5103)